MAYTPKEWECGEVITADALNHLEQGVAEAGGGGTPSIIKIGTANGSGWTMVDANLSIYAFSGGVNSIGATFGETIGERTVLAIVAESFGCFEYWLGSNTIPLIDQDVFKRSHSMAINGISNHTVTGGADMHSFDVYAICI